MACVGQVQGAHRGCELGVPQGGRDEPGMDTRVKQMGGVRMAEGRDGAAHLGDAGPLLGCAEGAVDTGATHGGGCRGTVGVSPPSGRQEPGGVPRGFPGGAQPRERLGGQRDLAVCGALPTVAMPLQALAVNSGALQEEGFVKPESQTRDRGAGDLVLQGGSRLEEASDFVKTEDSGEMVRGLRAPEGPRSPVACEDVLREEANSTVADTHGRGGEAINIFAVQEGVLQLLFGDTVGGCVVELSQETDFADVGCLSPFARAADVERRNHVLTQRGHELSPFVRHVVGVRRKTSETDEGRKRGLMTAASAAYLNFAVEPTLYSVRSAPASGRGSGPALI